MFFVLLFLVITLFTYFMISGWRNRMPREVARTIAVGAGTTVTLFLLIQIIRLAAIAAVSGAAGLVAFKYLDTVVKMGDHRLQGWLSFNGMLQRGLGILVFVFVAATLFSSTRRR